MTRKIAMVGKGGTFALAPWQEKEWEIWGMPWIFLPRYTRLFDPHSQAMCDGFVGGDREETWLPEATRRYADVPVYCDPSRLHAFPSGIEYPLGEIRKALPIAYLENTIAYQLAMAIWEHGNGLTVDEIGLWGIHMMGRSEFVWQRPSITYLVGLAQGRGITVSIAPGSPLFMSGYVAGRYGLSADERNASVITGAL